MLDECYRDNPLVNVFCLGTLPVERLVLGRASGVGNLAVLFGSTTGRDGIGGVSVLASAGFTDDEADASKRPSVQVGDPFEEKRLIEACLALLRPGGLIAIDNVLWSGSVADPSDQKPDTVALRAITAKVRADSRVDACLLSIGDGVLLAHKLR